MDKVLTSDQERAKNLIAEWFLNADDKIFVLSGYAGTGKTFLIDYVVREVLHLKPGTEAVFVTPTGKAATVLIRGGTVAGTVHSLIYVRNEDDFDVDENGEIVERQTLSFTKREKIDERIRLIVVDEASMIAEDVLRDLLSFGVKCLFSGDGAQLPPVNGSCGLLENPDYTLTEIVRQAADNPIIRIATMAREGKAIPYGNYGDKVSVVGRGYLSPNPEAGGYSSVPIRSSAARTVRARRSIGKYGSTRGSAKTSFCPWRGKSSSAPSTIGKSRWTKRSIFISSTASSAGLRTCARIPITSRR